MEPLLTSSFPSSSSSNSDPSTDLREYENSRNLKLVGIKILKNVILNNTAVNFANVNAGLSVNQ